jgi:hypothetical protein
MVPAGSALAVCRAERAALGPCAVRLPFRRESSPGSPPALPLSEGNVIKETPAFYGKRFFFNTGE